MNVALRKVMSLAEFLAWEDRQELRHEFDGQHARAMTDGTAGHAVIQANLTAALVPRLRGKRCAYYGEILKFLTAEGTVRYPDGMVVCAPVDRKAKWVDNPTVVFEVLSPSTARVDRIAKAREYQASPSVQRYVMLEQDGIGAVVYARAGDAWTHELLDADANLALPEIDVTLPLAELYEGLNFEDEDEDEASA
jgi:Uma2 family endonuclease